MVREQFGPHLLIRQQLVKAARRFEPLLDILNFSEEEIDDAIEELRPLRMHIHALDYGDAPGFRETNLEIH